MNPDFSLLTLEEKLLKPEADLSHLNAEEQFNRIMSKIANIDDSVISQSELLDRLKKSKLTGQPLRIKFGIDPTGPDIHIGHAVSLINLRLFQRMGHKLILIIGDFTAMIGDPSGRSDDRPALTRKDILKNMESYEAQAGRLVDLSDTSIKRHHNSEWMNKLTMREWIEIIKKISASSLLQREDFRKRFAAGHGLSIAELEYALYMAYDSVVLKPDIEIGGVDQYLNMHMCRQMMSHVSQRPEVVITYNLLPGTTGEKDDQLRLIKMSKSRGNYIPVTEKPSEMYGKVMSIPDEVMWIWYRELTEISPRELDELKKAVSENKVHPKDTKQLLARVITATFNGYKEDVIKRAEADFNSKFGSEAVLVPDSTIEITFSEKDLLIDALSKATKKSKSDLRRLSEQSGIRILKNNEYSPIDVEELQSEAHVYENNVIRIGKRIYCRIKG